jgi:hypothetical protein
MKHKLGRRIKLNGANLCCLQGRIHDSVDACAVPFLCLFHALQRPILNLAERLKSDVRRQLRRQAMKYVLGNAVDFQLHTIRNNMEYRLPTIAPKMYERSSTLFILLNHPLQRLSEGLHSDLKERL